MTEFRATKGFKLSKMPTEHLAARHALTYFTSGTDNRRRINDLSTM